VGSYYCKQENEKKSTFEEVIFDTFNKNGKIVSELYWYDIGRRLSNKLIKSRS
jgi:hypothetical protein